MKKELEKQKDNSFKGYQKPNTLDREQLEYTFKSTLSYGVILFAVGGVCASVAYMTVQQLKK